MQGKVFLSHSSKQKDIVSKIAEAIGRNSCVYDNYDFESGLPIMEEILEGLNNTDLFVIFISSDALNSEWVRRELSEAEKLEKKGTLKQILPLLVDESIDVSKDKRIPEFLRDYLLKPITDIILIKKKINQRRRELSINSNPLNRDREDIFIGRKTLLDDFETSIFNIGRKKPKAIIVSGIEGIGRRTFLKKAFLEGKIIKKYYEPIYIYLDTKNSIEDFIIQLYNEDSKNSPDLLKELKSLDIDEKVEEAKRILLRIIANKEHIFILDSGCIVKPTKFIADWFLQLLNDDVFNNSFALSIISQFRPVNDWLKNHTDIVEFHLNSLSTIDTEKLYVLYSRHLGIEIIEEKYARDILDILIGIPSQVYYAVDLIHKYGIVDVVKKYKSDIIEYGTTKFLYIINSVREEGQFAFDLLVLLSSYDILSYDMIERIVGNNPKLDETLEKFYILGVFDQIGSAKEYLRVHYVIADYITRSKTPINSRYKLEIKNIISDFLVSEDLSNDLDDLSQLLLSVKGALLQGAKINDKYYVPSFILKTIIELYYKEKYKNIISLAKNMLDNSRRLESDIEREIRYWLCLALARERKEDEFESEVEKMDGADYYFLKGFFHRRKNDLKSAEFFLNKALTLNSSFQRAKRELVNVMLVNEDYNRALGLAQNNYCYNASSKLNAFHIQAYFICLVKGKNYLNKEDKAIINELMTNIQKSYDHRSQEIHSVMCGEFEFYINKDVSKSILILKDCLKRNRNKHYPYKALSDIYKKQKMYGAIDELKKDRYPETFDD